MELLPYAIGLPERGYLMTVETGLKRRAAPLLMAAFQTVAGIGYAAAAEPSSPEAQLQDMPKGFYRVGNPAGHENCIGNVNDQANAEHKSVKLTECVPAATPLSNPVKLTVPDNIRYQKIGVYKVTFTDTANQKTACLASVNNGYGYGVEPSVILAACRPATPDEASGEPIKPSGIDTNKRFTGGGPVKVDTRTCTTEVQSVYGTTPSLTVTGCTPS